MQERRRTIARRIGAAGVVMAVTTVAGCTRENVCYEPQEMPEFGHVLRAVPCEEADDAPEAEQ